MVEKIGQIELKGVNELRYQGFLWSVVNYDHSPPSGDIGVSGPCGDLQKLIAKAIYSLQKGYDIVFDESLKPDEVSEIKYCLGLG